MPEGVQIVDGARRACARRCASRSKYGADWIKFYADRSYYKTNDPKRPLRSWVNFTKPEMDGDRRRGAPAGAEGRRACDRLGRHRRGARRAASTRSSTATG